MGFSSITVNRLYFFVFQQLPVTTYLLLEHARFAGIDQPKVERNLSAWWRLVYCIYSLVCIKNHQDNFILTMNLKLLLPDSFVLWPFQHCMQTERVSAASRTLQAAMLVYGKENL